MTQGELSRRAVVVSACCCGVAACVPTLPLASQPPQMGDGRPQLLELGTGPMERIAKTVWVARIAPGVWLHSTTGIIAGTTYYPANGLILERSEGSLLVDTGWDSEQALVLLEWSKQHLGAPITQALATHFHYDRTGGIPGLQARGIVTYAHPLTCELARARNTVAGAHKTPVPEPIAEFGAAPYSLNADCELYFPGAGHTRDNIVVWLPRAGTLFGGCFLKSVTSPSLGNLEDAVIADWPASVRNVSARYPNPRIVVPGHGTMTGDSLGRTLALLAASQKS